MSDFAETVLPEEPVETPEESKEQSAWEKAGFASEEEALSALTKLSEERKRINDEKSELGRLKKEMAELEAKKEPEDESDDIFAELDPKTAEKFRKAIRKEAEAVASAKFGSQVEVAEELFNDNAAKLFDEYAKANSLEADDLYGFMQQYNLFPTKPSITALKNQLDLAVDAYKGRNLEQIVTQRMADEMAKLKKDGAEVTAVEPASKKTPDDDDTDAFERLSFADKLKAVASGKF